MKKYTKPTVEVKSFATVNKIADVSTWLSGAEASALGVNGVDTGAITSYYVAS